MDHASLTVVPRSNFCRRAQVGALPSIKTCAPAQRL
jgi:hypothetical protein